MGISASNMRIAPSNIYGMGIAIEKANRQELVDAAESLDFNRMGQASKNLSIRNALITSYNQDDVKYWKDNFSGQDQQIYNTLRAAA